MKYLWQIPLLILLIPVIILAMVFSFAFQSRHHPVGYGFGSRFRRGLAKR